MEVDVKVVFLDCSRARQRSSEPSNRNGRERDKSKGRKEER